MLYIKCLSFLSMPIAMAAAGTQLLLFTGILRHFQLTTAAAFPWIQSQRNPSPVWIFPSFKASHHPGVIKECCCTSTNKQLAQVDAQGLQPSLVLFLCGCLGAMTTIKSGPSCCAAASRGRSRCTSGSGIVAATAPPPPAIVA